MYSVGVLFFELLTGKPPFIEQQFFSLAERHLVGEISFPHRVKRAWPKELQSIVHRCLAKSPHDRPAAARSLLELLTPWEVSDSDRKALACAVRETRESSSFLRMRKALHSTGVLLSLCIACLILGAAIFIRQNRNLQALVGANVIAIEHRLGIGLPLPRKYLNIQARFDKPDQIFELLHPTRPPEFGASVSLARSLILAGVVKNIRYTGNPSESRGRTMLHFLATNPHARSAPLDQELRTLLAAGEDVNARDRAHNTPFHYAVGNLMTTDVQHMLRFGADPFPRNKTGEAPFHLAVKSGDLAKTRIIVRAIASPARRVELVNWPTAQGVSPLQLARRLPTDLRYALEQFLLESGAQDSETKLKDVVK